MANTNTLQEFKEKFRVEELLISRNRSWSWSVRPAQPTLGAGIISLNRYALNFSDVTSEEMSDLGKLVALAETAVKSSFQYNIMNYLMLMMVDHHVHFHAIPRYDGVREFRGLKWTDNGWPALPVMSDAQYAADASALAAIQNALKSHT